MTNQSILHVIVVLKEIVNVGLYVCIVFTVFHA